MKKSKASVSLFSAQIRNGRDLAIAVTEGISGLENASDEQKLYMIQGVANGLKTSATILRDHPEEAEKCAGVFDDAARAIMQTFACINNESEQRES